MAFMQASEIETQSSMMIALTGASASGKTIAAMILAMGLGGKTAIVNTEKHGALVYRDREDLGLLGFDFLYQKLVAPFTPEAYIKMIEEAEQAGCNNIIFDSLSHEWNGTGGVLELVDKIATAKFKGNTWSAWSEMTPRHKALLDRMASSKMNVICTMRSKTETVQEDDPNKKGKKRVVKVGMKPEQRDGIEYEFTIFIDMQEDHTAYISNDRTGVLYTEYPEKITIETGKKLMEWQEGKLKQQNKVPEPQYTQNQQNFNADIDKIIKPLDDRLKELKEKQEFSTYYITEFDGEYYRKHHNKTAAIAWNLVRKKGESLGLKYIKAINSWIDPKKEKDPTEGIVK